MGYDASAATVIGVYLRIEDIYKEIPVTNRQCTHCHTGVVQDARFCQNCGRKFNGTKMAMICSIGENTALGLDFVSGGSESSEFVIGKKLNECSHPSCFLRHDSFDGEFLKIKSLIKETLEPHGLWHEEHFGIWTILRQSC